MDQNEVFLNPVPNGLRPRSFYSVDRRAIYLAMGFRTKNSKKILGDPKLPSGKGWRAYIQELNFDLNGLDLNNPNQWKSSKHGYALNIDPKAWDSGSVDFGPLDLYNCDPSYIKDERFDKLRAEMKEVASQLYGPSSIRAQNIKPIEHFTLEQCWIGRLNVKLMPPYGPKDGKVNLQERNRIEGSKGHSFQRVLVQCPHCMEWQYFGRLNQHMYASYNATERSKVCRAREAEIKSKEGVN